MIILHGIWVPCRKKHTPSKFYIWGERVPIIEDVVKTNRAKRSSCGGKHVAPHPFAVSGDILINILDTIRSAGELREPNTSGDDVPTYKVGRQHIRLPTDTNVRKAPLCSIDTIVRTDVKATGRTDYKICSWSVSTVELEPIDAFILLATLHERSDTYSGELTFGSDLRFWSTTAKFTLELLARQRFLPFIHEDNKSLYARWLPVINNPKDVERLELLISSMPACCRAAIGAESTSAHTLILDFINTVIDCAIRTWIDAQCVTVASWRQLYQAGEDLISIWLRGLCTVTTNKLKCTPHQATILRKSINDWVASIVVARELQKLLPWRTCFRLEEPMDIPELTTEAEQQGRQYNWQLTFHLQAMDDKSLIIPARELWEGRLANIKFVDYRSEHPEDRFLEDIVNAARLFKPIEQSLKSELPTGCTITTAEAYRFLKEGAWLLEECGYGVLLPSWWRYKQQVASLGLKLKLKSPKVAAGVSGSGFFDLNSIVKFDWEIALGDTVLSLQEFKKLAELKQPLVKLRGRWIEISPEGIEAAMNFLDRTKIDGLTIADALRLNSGQLDIGLPVVEVRSTGWLADFIAGGFQGRFTELDTPVGFNGKLRPYQVRGFSWLAFLAERGLGACLADDMGLGKTIQFIALLLYCKKRFQTRRKLPPALLICPTSVVGNWKLELERFAPSLRVMVHHGITRSHGSRFVNLAKQHDIVISTYSLAYRDEHDFKKVNWLGIVLDEAQNIKSYWTRQARAIRNLSCRYRIALTGTPVENRLTELWSIMEFLNPGFLGSQPEFKRQFANPIERYNDRDASDTLRKLIQPFVLRRLKTDRRIIRDLPEKLEMKVYCTLTPEQATLYQATVDNMMHEIVCAEGMTRRGLVLSTLMKLKQICDHPALFLQDGSAIDNRSGKLMRFREMIEEALAVGDKALVFTQFVTMGKMLQSELQSQFGCEVLFLHGQVPRKLRDKMITRFQSERGPPIFILSVKAGGFGLNLTAASHVFHFDRWWNPAVESQATDRAFRIGQKKRVQVHKFVTIGTLEERIDQMLEHKKGLAESILGKGESWLTELSNDELRELFALRADTAVL